MEHPFDELTRALATGLSRRELLRRVAGLIPALVLAAFGLERPAWAASCGTFCQDHVPAGKNRRKRLSQCRSKCNKCRKTRRQPCWSPAAGTAVCCASGDQCCDGVECIPDAGTCCNTGDGSYCDGHGVCCADPNGGLLGCCPPGRECCRGNCCGAGLSCCGVKDGCKDLWDDRRNCGACGRVCPTGMICESGRCVGVVCPAGKTACINYNWSSGQDKSSCCLSWEQCEHGVCYSPCPAGTRYCGNNGGAVCCGTGPPGPLSGYCVGVCPDQPVCCPGNSTYGAACWGGGVCCNGGTAYDPSDPRQICCPNGAGSLLPDAASHYICCCVPPDAAGRFGCAPQDARSYFCCADGSACLIGWTCSGTPNRCIPPG